MLGLIYSAGQEQLANAQMQSQLFTWGILIIGLIIYWVLVLVPHNKKRKEMENKLKNLSKGDKVVTIGGVHGKVSSVKDDIVVLKVDDKTEITFDKTAIAKVLSQDSNKNENPQNSNEKKDENNNKE